jgi:hypothetical protein
VAASPHDSESGGKPPHSTRLGFDARAADEALRTRTSYFITAQASFQKSVRDLESADLLVYPPVSLSSRSGTDRLFS